MQATLLISLGFDLHAKSCPHTEQIILGQPLDKYCILRKIWWWSASIPPQDLARTRTEFKEHNDSKTSAIVARRWHPLNEHNLGKGGRCHDWEGFGGW